VSDHSGVRVDSVVLVFCTKFGSNICYSHWDRRTYPSELHLMTSHELTSGFDFWSRGHLRMKHGMCVVQKVRSKQATTKQRSTTAFIPLEINRVIRSTSYCQWAV